MEWVADVCAFVVGFLLGRFWQPTRSPPQERVCGDQLCHSRADPRCVAGNCTYHCNTILGCNGACLKSFEAAEKSEAVARQALSKARER